MHKNCAFFEKIRPEILALAAGGDFLDKYSNEHVPDIFYQWFLYQESEAPDDHAHRIRGTIEVICDTLAEEHVHKNDKVKAVQTMREFGFLTYYAGISRHASLNDDQIEGFEDNIVLTFDTLAHMFQCQTCFKKVLRYSE